MPADAVYRSTAPNSKPAPKNRDSASVRSAELQFRGAIQLVSCPIHLKFRNDLAILTIRQAGQRGQADRNGNRPHVAIGQYELAYARMITAELAARRVLGSFRQRRSHLSKHTIRLAREFRGQCTPFVGLANRRLGVCSASQPLDGEPQARDICQFICQAQIRAISSVG